MGKDKMFADKVIQYYTLMADNGNADAQYTLALILLDGKFVESDFARALAYLEAATNQGHEEAKIRYFEETAIDDDGRYDAWV